MSFGLAMWDRKLKVFERNRKHKRNEYNCVIDIKILNTHLKKYFITVKLSRKNSSIYCTLIIIERISKNLSLNKILGFFLAWSHTITVCMSA